MICCLDYMDEIMQANIREQPQELVTFQRGMAFKLRLTSRRYSGLATLPAIIQEQVLQRSPRRNLRSGDTRDLIRPQLDAG